MYCANCRVVLGIDFVPSKSRPELCTCCAGECSHTIAQHADWDPMLNDWQWMHDAEHPGPNGETTEENEKGECEQ